MLKKWKDWKRFGMLRQKLKNTKKTLHNSAPSNHFGRFRIILGKLYTLVHPRANRRPTLYIYIYDLMIMMKGGMWWGREVVRKGSGDEGKWWWRGVVRKGSGDDGKWWGREVVAMGSDEEGKWEAMELLTMKKWWGREVVTMGSGEEGKWWRWEVVRNGRSQWNGCMNVAWAMSWGGSRSTKPCVFPCKVAAGDDERCLGSFGSFYVFCNNACSCVRSSMRFLTLWCQIALEWLHDITCRVLWGGSRSTKPCVFPCKVAAAGDERYLVCAAVAAGVVWFLLCVLQQCLFRCAFYSFLDAVVPDRIGMAAWCYMSCVVGRKPEHETVCFSV